MATVEAFESALKEVVQAKRLSQSKMASLTEVALKCMDNDTQMVSILYRTHKGLSPSAKVWSLYAFDALARAARNRANKSNMTGNLSSEKGNCATFLLKIEGILDGLFQDLILSGSDELKEKAKKILDIWTKSNTFSSAVLSPLYALLTEAEKNKESAQADTTKMASTEPSAPALPSFYQPPTSQPPAIPPVDVNAIQSTLFALLSKATSAVGTAAPAPSHVQIAPNTVPVPPAAPAPVLDANQLALLQQLAQTAQGNAVPSQPIPVPASVVPSLTTPNAVPVIPPVQGPPQPQPFPYRDDHYGAPAPQRESEHDRFNGNGPERGYPRDNHSDPRRDFRGGPRDHGRSGRGRGRRGGREHRDRSRDFSRDPRRGRSRSRSPPGRYGGPGPRDPRAHSPPRRGGYGQYGQRQSQGYGAGADWEAQSRPAPEAGKDEFGRDLRQDSPRDTDPAPMQAYQRRSASPPPPRAGSVTVSDRGSAVSENTNHAPYAAPYHQSNDNTSSYPYEYPPGLSAPPPISPSTSTAPSTSEQPQASDNVGLEGFDRASFDLSKPESWEALGKAWIKTHGSMPTQEQLMQFVLGNVSLPPPQEQPSQQPQPQSQPSHQSQPQPYSQQGQPEQHYGDTDQWQGHSDRQWSAPQGPRAGLRGRPGNGGNFGGPGRGQGRGRGDFGRGHGRGDFGSRRGFGRGDYGHGNGRGAYNAGGRGYQDEETDAVTLSGGDDSAWHDQEQQHHGYQSQPYGQQQQQHHSYHPQPSYGQPPPTQQYDSPPRPQASHGSAGGGGTGGGGGSAGRMQKVGDKWVFVRGAA